MLKSWKNVRNFLKIFAVYYRVAAINPEFFTSYFEMTQHSWKSSDFIEVKTNVHK